eukprot:1492710-Rhodomonas_salina.1
MPYLKDSPELPDNEGGHRPLSLRRHVDEAIDHDHLALCENFLDIEAAVNMPSSHRICTGSFPKRDAFRLLTRLDTDRGHRNTGSLPVFSSFPPSRREFLHDARLRFVARDFDCTS